MLRQSPFVRLCVAFALAVSTSGVAHADPAACVPQCRSGYVCVSAKCVSACNPPCAAGEQCTPQGECLTPGQAQQSVAPAAPAPTPPAAAPPGPASGWPAAAPATPPPAPGGAATVPPAAAPARDAWTVPTSSGAQPSPESSAEPKHHSLPRTHDGFYLRLGLGVGYLAGGLSSAGFHAESVDDMSNSGVGILGEFSLGGTILPGLVIGGGSFSTTVPSNTVTVKSGGQSLDFSGGSAAVASVGPFADYYFDPSGGLHAQAALLIANVSATKGSPEQTTGLSFPPDDYSGFGYGFMLGFGYETWVGDEWSVGGLARLTYLASSLKPKNGGDTIDASFWTPGALLTVTYH